MSKQNEKNQKEKPKYKMDVIITMNGRIMSKWKSIMLEVNYKMKKIESMVY